jgi:PTH1 family peptidyl-tRNA hydrolase
MGRVGNLFGRFRKGAKADRTAQSPSGPAWLVAGLGNPGGQYGRSRHNVGFMTLDHLAGRHHVTLDRRRFNALCAEISIDGQAALLAQPQTFYNASGESVAAILGYFRIAPGNLIVVHDDLDLEAGRLRLKRGGGDAGNRGVRSIAASLGVTDFIRVRIGIGRPPGETESKDYVLRPMSAGELTGIDQVIERAADAVEALVMGGLERAMERFNQRA